MPPRPPRRPSVHDPRPATGFADRGRDWFPVEVDGTVAAGGSLGLDVGGYTGFEVWLDAAGNRGRLVGGRELGAVNPGVPLDPDVTFAVGDLALARAAEGAGGQLWELATVGGGGGLSGGAVSTTDCAGCGWLTAMTTSYCVRFTQHSQAGACDCSDTAGQTSLGTYNGVQTKWLGATNFTICGADYTPKFWYTTTADGQLAPQLTLTAVVGGAVYTARFICCYGCCAKFALYDATVCDGDFDHLTGPCGNVVYYTVCWHTCATCTTCPDATLPNAMAFAFGSDGTGDLACLNGEAGVMPWNPGTLWELNPVTLCGNSGLVNFACSGGTTFAFGAQFANPPGNLTGTLTDSDCETLTFTFTVTSDSASGSITVVVTPDT